ncbi:MAG: xanthine dehydrogenase family protein molybdopterin-binding subunit [Dehalococcoidales bacterium]|jgi:CO/xanthine dehydrogenase Mo-binding subunit|nr:xanthine dehydrogenase family protein molybdopterin-binding subunit [Dehalococcoidales bacterium]MDD4465849.1 xanthine dehydrogenase family protein molybdopterin-binding subunit [Dehalococcoidales bacterium]MDX9803312.1 xanthine dehydrogenase family protein molybdopterin-binding subunit [Dehalococcoidales bacterium]
MFENLAVITNPANKDKQIYSIVTGRLDYAADNMLGKKLFCRTLLSPYPRAKIISINTSAAMAVPGVKAICTYEDCPQWSQNIYFAGQEVAGVAAVDEATAARAVKLITVEYEQYPFVVGPDEAMAPGAPLVGTVPEKNTQGWELMRGDFEAGFANADVDFTTTIGWTQYFQHGNIESTQAVCAWTGDHLYVWTTSQNPFAGRSSVASALGIPQNRVHLISHGTGNGHGNKLSMPWLVPAAVLAKKAGMPVLYARTRYEEFNTQGHQFPLKATIRLGMKNDGTLVAADSHYLGDAAATSSNRSTGGNDSLRYTYRIPDARFLGTGTATNKPPTSAWRCVQHPPGTWISEIAIDQAAEEVGMNPLDFRYKNILNPDEVDLDSGLPMASNGQRECLEKVAAAIGWNANYHEVGARTLEDGRKHGIGICGHVDGHGSMSSVVGAIVNLTRDGTCLISSGISRASGGTNTAHCHIVAETLGMKYEDVNTGDWGNTDVCSEGGSQGGSTRTITTGAAFQIAAEDALAQVLETAALMFGVDASELATGDSKVFLKSDPNNSKTFREVCGRNSWSIVGRGYGWGKVLRHREVAGFPIGSPCEVRGVTAGAAEVAVDTETGVVEVLKFAQALDNGRAIFYQGSMNQILGGCEINIHQALFMEQIVDKDTGLTVNGSYLDHKWGTSLDFDTAGFSAALVEGDDACGPYGCKGMGEPCISNMSSIASAVYNAIGVWIHQPPITPQKVLKALGKA